VPAGSADRPASSSIRRGEWVRFVDYDTTDKLEYLAKVLLWKQSFSVPSIVPAPSIIKELEQADQSDL
jgi:hypothetical protein